MHCSYKELNFVNDTSTTGATPVCECPVCETSVCECPVCETPDHECPSSTAALITGVIIGLLVGARSCGLIITCVAVKG